MIVLSKEESMWSSLIDSGFDYLTLTDSKAGIEDQLSLQ
jgi:hypothetical protein